MAEHVGLTKGGAFLCGHCGASYTPAYPAPIRVLSAAMGAFIEMHEGCEPRQPTASTPATKGARHG